MIEQQYYTHDRMRHASGELIYHTVAKSPLLKQDYIRKYIEPLCEYSIPEVLRQRRGNNEQGYPARFIIFPSPMGELIVGQATYQASGVEGFFMHNFVLSAKEKRRYMKEPEKLFGMSAFMSAYTPRMGNELPTLAAVPYEGVNPYFQSRERLLHKLGMNEVTFAQLIYASFMATQSKKKIFVVLNAELTELEELSKALLYHLYRMMPWRITEQLGVCTYATQLEAKKSIQITFLDPQGVYDEQRSSREFIFDLIGNRIHNIQDEVAKEPYMEVAIKYSHNKLAWEKLNRWADELRPNQEVTGGIEYYNKIAILLDMSVHMRNKCAYNMNGYKVRPGWMLYLIQLLSLTISNELKVEIFNVMNYTIGLLRERVILGELFTANEVKALLYFKWRIMKESLQKESECILLLIELLIEAIKQEHTSYIEQLLEEVKVYPKAFAFLCQKIYEIPVLRTYIVYPQLEHNLGEVETFDELCECMEQLNLLEPVLIDDAYYKEKVCEVLQCCLERATEIDQVLKQAKAWCQGHSGLLYRMIEEQCEAYFIAHIDLLAIKEEKELCTLKFLYTYEHENYQVIKAYQQLRQDISYMSPKKMRIDLRVQQLIKHFYENKVVAEDFYMLVYAFLEENPDTKIIQLNLKEALIYLYSVTPEIMLDFITWSKGQILYMNPECFNEEVLEIFQLLHYREDMIPHHMIKERWGSDEQMRDLYQRIAYTGYPTWLKRVVYKVRG